MSDIHIDDFYRDTAKILVALYNTFPRKVTLYVEDIAGPDTPDEFGLHSPRHEACLHTMLWLASTGYLCYHDLVKQEAIDEVVLTQKAFLSLNRFLTRQEMTSRHNASQNRPPTDNANSSAAPPEMVSREKMVINVLRHELKNGSSFTLNARVQALMEMF